MLVNSTHQQSPHITIIPDECKNRFYISSIVNYIAQHYYHGMLGCTKDIPSDYIMNGGDTDESLYDAIMSDTHYGRLCQECNYDFIDDLMSVIINSTMEYEFKYNPDPATNIISQCTNLGRWIECCVSNMNSWQETVYIEVIHIVTGPLFLMAKRHQITMKLLKSIPSDINLNVDINDSNSDVHIWLRRRLFRQGYHPDLMPECSIESYWNNSWNIEAVREFMKSRSS